MRDIGDYTGELNGKRLMHGRGTLLLGSGDTVTGQFFEGNIEKGQYLFVNGDVYEGLLKNFRPNGRGVLRGSGYVLDATFENGDAKTGSLKYSNEETYSGSLERLMPNGTGFKIFRDGSRYDGLFVDGFPEGRGRMALPAGYTIDADFKKGSADSGIVKFRSGAMYCGPLERRMATGRGKIEFPDGSEYHGMVQDGLPDDDSGVFKFKSGAVSSYCGRVTKGVQTGKGKIEYRDESAYDGLVEGLIPSGEGKMTLADGSTLQGTFRNGKITGKGALLSPVGLSFAGEFVDGLPARGKAHSKFQTADVEFLPDGKVRDMKTMQVMSLQELTSFLEEDSAASAASRALQTAPTPTGAVAAPAVGSVDLMRMGSESAVMSPKRPLLVCYPKIAFVVGNQNYKKRPLLNPIHDAEEVAKTFKARGFEVFLHRDLDMSRMNTVIQSFRLSKGKIAVFFFSGHGVQHEGRNFLLPIGTSEDADEFSRETLGMGAAVFAQRLVTPTEDRLGMDPVAKFVILDCCRSDPPVRAPPTRGGCVESEGMAVGMCHAKPVPETVVLYACQPGAVAADSDPVKFPHHGALTTVLLDVLSVVNDEGHLKYNLPDMLKGIKRGVRILTDDRQVPYVEDLTERIVWLDQGIEDTVLP